MKFSSLMEKDIGNHPRTIESLDIVACLLTCNAFVACLLIVLYIGCTATIWCATVMLKKGPNSAVPVLQSSSFVRSAVNKLGFPRKMSGASASNHGIALTAGTLEAIDAPSKNVSTVHSILMKLGKIGPPQ